MAENFVTMEKKGAVATLTLNRPEKKNSLNGVMLVAISQYLQELARAEEIRAVVIRGAGGEAFSSGFDIGEIPTNITQGSAEAPPVNPLDMG
ncbi:MAG: enoyl-CoA hydratase/isomerase family protein, partial [Smithellaceae bacterium]|nr:enoyl-CoA hydratase/isomerase family protein [Smithellaceae bacterium]